MMPPAARHPTPPSHPPEICPTLPPHPIMPRRDVELGPAGRESFAQQVTVTPRPIFSLPYPTPVASLITPMNRLRVPSSAHSAIAMRSCVTGQFVCAASRCRDADPHRNRNNATAPATLVAAGKALGLQSPPHLLSGHWDYKAQQQFVNSGSSGQCMPPPLPLPLSPFGPDAPSRPIPVLLSPLLLTSLPAPLSVFTRGSQTFKWRCARPRRSGVWLGIR